MYDEKEIKYKKRKKKTTKNKINLKKIPKINFNWNTIIPPIVKKINYKQLSLRLSLLLLVMMSVIFLLSRINKQNTQINEKFDENIMLITNAVIAILIFHFVMLPYFKNIFEMSKERKNNRTKIILYCIQL